MFQPNKRNKPDKPDQCQDSRPDPTPRCENARNKTSPHDPLRIKGQKVEAKLKLIKKLFQNYRNKLLNNFVIITDKKLRFIPMEDIK
jgi:hypothetical protein